LTCVGGIEGVDTASWRRHQLEMWREFVVTGYVEIRPAGSFLFRTGISLAMPPQCGCLLRGRSSLEAIQQLKLYGGVIDADYRGEIFVKLVNHGYSPQKVSCGDRIAQAIFIRNESLEFSVTDMLDVTERGANGFGSTNKG
jgi:dUTP pyrophosphatase